MPALPTSIAEVRRLIVIPEVLIRCACPRRWHFSEKPTFVPSPLRDQHFAASPSPPEFVQDFQVQVCFSSYEIRPPEDRLAAVAIVRTLD